MSNSKSLAKRNTTPGGKTAMWTSQPACESVNHFSNGEEEDVMHLV